MNQWIRDMLSYNCSTGTVLNSLDAKFPGHSIQERAIKQVKEEIKAGKYGGLNSAQVLEMQLVDQHIPHRFWTNEEDNVTAFLLLNPDSIRLFRRFPSVVMMDCTYRTNQYNMPALHIMGVCGLGRGFLIGVVLLAREMVPFYHIILEEVR